MLSPADIIAASGFRPKADQSVKLANSASPQACTSSGSPADKAERIPSHKPARASSVKEEPNTAGDKQRGTKGRTRRPSGWDAETAGTSAAPGAAPQRAAESRDTDIKFVARQLALKFDPPTVMLVYQTVDKTKKKLRSVKLHRLQTSADELTASVLRAFPRGLDPKSINSKQIRKLIIELQDHVLGQSPGMDGEGHAKAAGARTAGGPVQGQGSRQASGSEKAAGPAAGKASNQRLDKLRGAAHDHSLHSMETNADEESIMRLGVVVDSDRDYNKVSPEELEEVKAAMNVVFNQTAVKPSDEGWTYNVQRTFEPASDSNDWDASGDEIEAKGSGCSDIPWEEIFSATRLVE